MNSILSWRDQIRAAVRQSESEAVANCLAFLEQTQIPFSNIATTAYRLVEQLRQKQKEGGQGLVQELMHEYALSSQEGVALMCLAEALLRVPDTATRDVLIRDKVSNNHWQNHLNQSSSFMVNAASWGLHITGKLVSTGSASGFSQALSTLIRKGGEPLIRKGMDYAMRLMGEQFVSGETIEKAIANGGEREKQGFRFSYDMLGEAAMTAQDAARYLHAYETAIHAIGQSAKGDSVYERAGISVKLSALHPRYVRAQRHRVMTELYPRLVVLVRLAKKYRIGVNIDAEESERLDISLDLFERLCHEPEFADFDGLGFVVQAYQKRGFYVLDFLINLAKQTKHRLMIRLVKGAYWDSEVKRAQQEGQVDYPVFTRKTNTDLSYLACAQKMLMAKDFIYSQFATHNAQTVASILEMAGDDYQNKHYEFQCLYGMGEPLYEQLSAGQTIFPRRPCRIYAPVGTYETLLPYLVRRLLENGANSSFVNRISDESVPIESLVEHPVQTVKKTLGESASHPQIPLPDHLFQRSELARSNSSGLDLAHEPVLHHLHELCRRFSQESISLEPVMAGQPVLKEESVWRDILSPANQGRKIGQIREADVAEVEFALTAAGASTWSQLPVLVKAEKLEAAAVALAKSDQLFQLIIHEAGKTLSNAVGEVREAVDFLNYYAAQLRKAEVLMAHAQPLGVSLVISPWNFPLAIPIGQVSAALAAGNTVILKPAEQSSMVALYATKLLHDAGIPKDALQCLPGRGESVGVALTSSGCFQSVLFTGSNETARRIESSLKKAHQQKGVEEPVFVAETGGINAMIVDSSALGEQVVSDVLQSAFDSAGQRCSALRLLCLQEDQAAHIMVLLKNAMLELTMGVPEFLQTDVGPVIDQEARDKIRNYIETCRARGLSVFQTAMPDSTAEGFFIAPTLIEVSSISEVNQEVFGPVLHVVRFSRDSLHQVLADIRRLGFGLTMGLHTRVDERIADVLSHSAVGNFYVNRNMIGAVVGVQPFGGEGLSGTGPKAGGPLMIPRLCRGLGLDWLEKMGVNEATFEQVRKLSLRSLVYVESLAEEAQGVRDRFDLFAKHISVQSKSAEKMSRLLYVPTVLTSITGEHNAWWMTKRGKVAVYAQDTDSLLRVSLFVLASGNQPVWVTEQKTKGTIESVYRQLPADLNRWVQLLPIDQIDRLSPEQRIDVVVCMDNLSLSFSGHGEIVRKINVSVENLDLVAYQESLMMSLLHERAISINTAAAGGNTSLMTMG